MRFEPSHRFLRFQVLRFALVIYAFPTESSFFAFPGFAFCVGGLRVRNREFTVSVRKFSDRLL